MSLKTLYVFYFYVYDRPKKKILFSFIHAKNCIGFFIFCEKNDMYTLTGDAESPINSHQSPSDRVMC